MEGGGHILTVGAKEALGRAVLCAAAIALCSASLCAGEADGRVDLGGAKVGFGLRLARPGRESVSVTSDDVEARSVERRGGGTVVTWRGHPVCGAGFAAVAEFEPQEGGWSWTFRYEGNEAEGLDVEAIDFPVVDAPRTDKTGVVYPKSLGVLEHPAWKSLAPGAEIVAAKPIAFRFIAACDGSAGGLYLDERGARGYAGRLVAENGREPMTVRLIARHLPVVTPGSNRAFALPYGGTVRRFDGGWYEAARIYRAWARTQPWASANRAKDRTRLRDIALWMWQRGASEGVVGAAERFQDETGLPPAVDWYWWHKIPYDTHYPFFWPPREGEAAFRAAIARMKKRGIFSQVYTNGASWDCDDPSWATDGGLEGARHEERGGSFLAYRYNVFTKHRLGHMCGEAPKFQDHFAKLAAKLADCGLDGLYMDQIGCLCFGSCWNPAHGHAPGGGRTMTDGFRNLFRRIRRENPGLLLSTEEPNEEYIEDVDHVICLRQNPERAEQRGWQTHEAVPVYQTLHHGETTLFGSFAILDGRPAWDSAWPDENRWRDEGKWDALFSVDLFSLEFVRGVVFGNQPCVHNLTLGQIENPGLAEGWRFLKETAAFYYANREFLYDGEMLHPGSMDCEQVPFTFPARSTYTTEKSLARVRSASPAVLHSVWRAPDGRIAAVLVNWTSQPRRYALTAPDAAAEGTIPPRSWRLAPHCPLPTAHYPLTTNHKEVQ